MYWPAASAGAVAVAAVDAIQSELKREQVRSRVRGGAA